ncbi:hypothetical protein V495_03381, partial [Pseudogymnoascus sp. VKM F-4514 (FW-929)]
MATEQTTPESSEAFWLFGYGSLIWKPPPHYGLSLSNLPSETPKPRPPRHARAPGPRRNAPHARALGYTRRFWQESHDHRGTPAHPGRVVTLLTREHWATLPDVHAAPEKVWGAAYHIPASHAAEVRDYLDIREINGYSIDYISFFPSEVSEEKEEGGEEGRKTIKALLYIGTPDNPQFTGAQDVGELAERIAGCEGPSGKNPEYLFNLEEALRGMGGDEH